MLPICLPKFNPNGFLYAFASFLRPQVGLVLVLVSASGEFDEVRKWSEGAISRLEAPVSGVASGPTSSRSLGLDPGGGAV